MFKAEQAPSEYMSCFRSSQQNLSLLLDPLCLPFFCRRFFQNLNGLLEMMKDTMISYTYHTGKKTKKT